VPKKTDKLLKQTNKLTFTVTVLVAQYRALFDGAVRTEQLSDVFLLLLLVQHSDEQLPVVCMHTSRQTQPINFQYG